MDSRQQTRDALARAVEERAAESFGKGAFGDWRGLKTAIDRLSTHDQDSRGGADVADERTPATGTGTPAYVAPNSADECRVSLLTYAGHFTPDYRVIDPATRRAVPTDRNLWKVIAAATQVCKATTTIETDGYRAEFAISDPRLSDGYVVWQGSDFTPDGETVDYRLPGRRANRGKARHEYVSWCVGTDTYGHPCTATHTDRRGKRGWACTEHGSECVRGGYVAAGLDDGEPERVKDSTGTLVANTRGKYVGTGSRKTYAGRSRGKNAQAITAELSEPVMASGRWGERLPSKWTATDKRGSEPCKAVLVYVGRIRTRDGSFRGKRLTKVLVRERGHGYKLATATPRGGFSSLVARDARAAAVLAEQIAAANVEKTERSRSSLVAAGSAIRADADLLARLSARVPVAK